MAQAISATTKGKIQASAPYIKFDGEEQAESALAHMFSIKLSDGRYYAPTDVQVRAGGTINWNTKENPIKLPIEGQTVADIETLIPSPSQRISLTDLIITNNNWRDNDGDGQGPNGVYITPTTGELKMELRDSNGGILNLSDPLNNVCGKTYYRLSLSATRFQLMTQYGMPRANLFEGSTINYYITSNRPYACETRFKIDSDPTKNFPRTGFHGAGFTMKVAGETVESIIKATEDTPGSGSVTQGGVTMKLTGLNATNVIKVILTGPNVETNGGIFTPSTFMLKSGVYNTPLYSFALSKWFVRSTDPQPYRYPDAESYCQILKGNYRIASVLEYGNGLRDGWGTSGGSRHSYFQIGNGERKGIIDPRDDRKGGLSSEWGHFTRQNYPASDWSDTDTLYLTSDRYYDREDMSWIYQSDFGTAGQTNSLNDNSSVNNMACVMP